LALLLLLEPWFQNGVSPEKAGFRSHNRVT
jgi:hypothetical protein